MSKALLIQDGDLVVGDFGYVEVTGRRKLLQDLRHALAEPYGSDRFHPRWGSHLPAQIGGVAGPAAELAIRAEVARVVQNYMLVQSEYLQQDSIAGVKPRFETDEVIVRLEDVRLTRRLTGYLVEVVLRTLSGQRESFVTEVRT